MDAESRQKVPATGWLAATDHDAPTALLGEGAELPVGQDLEHGFWRPAQPHAEWRHDDRPVDQDRVRHHGVEELAVGQRRIVQAKLIVRRAFPP